jgi:hypothetical protein
VERTFDYFAKGDDGAVYNFGKDVDEYGVGSSPGTRAGSAPPAIPVRWAGSCAGDLQLGDCWHFEFVPEGVRASVCEAEATGFMFSRGIGLRSGS